MEAIKEKINTAKISKKAKKNLTDLINDNMDFDENLIEIIKYENKLFEKNKEKTINNIIEIITAYRDKLSDKDSKFKYLDRYIAWSEMKSKHRGLRQLIEKKFIGHIFQKFNDITEDSVKFLLKFLENNNFLKDSVLTIDVKKTLIKLIINVVQDTTVKYTYAMEDLGCYMRGDDKNYGLRHENSTFTKTILGYVEKIMNFVGDNEKYLKEEEQSRRKKYLKWWMKTYATRNKRYVEVSSSECGQTANKRKLPNLKL